MVSGAAAVLLAQHPAATPDDIKGALVDGATRISGGAPRGRPRPSRPRRRATRLVAALPGRVPRPRPRPRQRDAVDGDAVGRRHRWTASRWTATRWTGGRWTETEWDASRWTRDAAGPRAAGRATRWAATRWTATQMDRGSMAVAELGMSAAPARRPRRLGRRVGVLIAAQLAVASAFGFLAHSRGVPDRVGVGRGDAGARVRAHRVLRDVARVPPPPVHVHARRSRPRSGLLRGRTDRARGRGRARRGREHGRATTRPVEGRVQRLQPARRDHGRGRRVRGPRQHERARLDRVGRRARRRDLLLDPRRRVDLGRALDRGADPLSQRVRPLRHDRACSRP